MAQKASLLNQPALPGAGIPRRRAGDLPGPPDTEHANSDGPLVTVVMPCLNEAGSVGECIDEALTAMRTAGIDGEVVVVDNGSTDGSPEIAAARGARVIAQPTRGYGAALQAGFHAAKGSIVVMAD